MPSFEFRNHVINLAIAGNDFKVNCVAELGEKIKKFHSEAAELAKRISDGKKPPAAATALCKKILDEILGDGAFDRIFKNRTPNITDCSDVLLFVIGEITEFFKNPNK